MVAESPPVLDRPLTGSVAVITGAARAIGQEIAVTLAARGARVASIDLAVATDTISSVEGLGGEAVDLTADVADESSVQKAFDEVRSHFGHIDILVNNAGLFAGLERRPFWDIDAAEWDRVTRVNIRSVWLCTRAASAPMRAANKGSIVNLSSNTVTFGMPNLLHYVASKAAVIGMTRSMAHELGPFGITVNAVAPGLVTTEITKEWVSEDYRRQVAEGQCINSPILPADIAKTVAFLCGPDARMITGQTVLVNGGATMGPA